MFVHVAQQSWFASQVDERLDVGPCRAPSPSWTASTPPRSSAMPPTRRRCAVCCAARRSRELYDDVIVTSGRPPFERRLPEPARRRAPRSGPLPARRDRRRRSTVARTVDGLRAGRRRLLLGAARSARRVVGDAVVRAEAAAGAADRDAARGRRCSACGIGAAVRSGCCSGSSGARSAAAASGSAGRRRRSGRGATTCACRPAAACRSCGR